MFSDVRDPFLDVQKNPEGFFWGVQKDLEGFKKDPEGSRDKYLVGFQV